MPDIVHFDGGSNADRPPARQCVLRLEGAGVLGWRADYRRGHVSSEMFHRSGAGNSRMP